MPHRNQELVELCRACKKPADDHCLRCGTPLCEDHAPVYEDVRCDRCETQYFDKKTRWLERAAGGHLHAVVGRPVVAFVSAFFVVPWLMAIGAILGAHAGGVTGGVLSALVMAVVGVFACRTWYARTPPRALAANRALRKRRRRFLRKRAQPLLEAPPAKPET